MYCVCDNPPARFPAGRPLSDDSGKWMVAHLRSRREKMAAHDFISAGIGYYLPLYEKRVRRRDTGKIRKTVNPLFPGYIAFVKSDDNKYAIRASKHIAAVIPVSNQERFVSELTQVQRILDSGADLWPHAALLPGVRVRVVSGPFKDVEGTVVLYEQQKRLVVGIEMFGQAVSIRIDEFEVEKIKGSV